MSSSFKRKPHPNSAKSKKPQRQPLKPIDTTFEPVLIPFGNAETNGEQVDAADISDEAPPKATH